MRVSWFLAVFSVFAAFLLLACVSANEVVDNNGIGFNSDIASSNRKLKEVMGKGGRKMVESTGDAKLDDYGPNDPSPVSKMIQPGPIEHGTPLMPFLPNPAAPPPPQLGG